MHRLIPCLFIAAPLALGGCFPKSTACYGISDAEAIKIARTSLAGTRRDDGMMHGYSIDRLVPVAIEHNTAARGDDGAVVVLFRDAASRGPGGVMQVIFEDCDTEWWADSDGTGLNGGGYSTTLPLPDVDKSSLGLAPKL